MAYLDEDNILSPNARRALQFVAAGLGAGEIAARLGCDRDAVRRHLADAMRTLSARSAPRAVAVAVRRGLIEAPARKGLVATQSVARAIEARAARAR